MLKLGAQLYTVRDYCKNEADFAATIAKLAKIGYNYVQVSGVGDVSPKAIADITASNGVKVILTHTSSARIMSETDRVIEEHSVFGCDAIGVGSLGNYPHTADGFLKFCEDFAPAIEKIKAAGKVFLYHNHHFEFEKFDGKNAMQIILENSDKDGLKLTFDTYWAQHAGYDPSKFIADNSERIFATHLKDMAVVKGTPVMTEVLTGNLNFVRILDESEKAGLLWHFVEQDTVYMDVIESMRISYNNLMATGRFE
ncbi:MAG: sugar phosphate isomerase/epimerase family protein [Eubacteriales bacterium]